MKIISSASNPTSFESDLLVVPVFEGELARLAGLEKIETDINISSKKENFSGKKGTSLILYTQGKIGSYKILLVGMGEKKKLTNYQLRVAVAKSLQTSLAMKIRKVGILLPSDFFSIFGAKILGQAVCESVFLGSYRFIRYKSKEQLKEEIEIEEVSILSSPAKISGVEMGILLGEIFAKATIEARDLINEPSSLVTPSYLAQKALDISKESKGAVSVTIYGYDEIKKMKMDAFLGVAKGSDEEPKFIVLKFKPKRVTKKIVIVGKGITFDTGGLSIKSSEHMETMKMDMSGAATILGVMQALPSLKSDVEVIGLIAACENMPSGKALKPGDILRAMNGKTIEVLNTDAEGRLTLADALSYGVKLKADAIIDLATLTGACMIALGQEIAGMWGNDKKIIDGVKRAADTVGEKVWEMPLEEEYKELIKSDVADLKNIQTGRYGGAITAALFLAEFVDKTPWVHLDIAGPAFEEKSTPLVPRGGAGFGVRTILEYLSNV